MKRLWWTIGASIASWLGVTTIAEADLHPEVLLGMLGPLASVAATRIVTERTHAAAPERLMGVTMAALVAKMVFFGVYVVVMLRVFELRPAPFVLSFTAYFIVLYLMEAIAMHRLLAAGDAPSGA
jgi:hypothetical protein